MAGGRATKCKDCKKPIYTHIPHFCGEETGVDILGVSFPNPKSAQKCVDDILKDILKDDKERLKIMTIRKDNG